MGVVEMPVVVTAVAVLEHMHAMHPAKSPHQWDRLGGSGGQWCNTAMVGGWLQ